MFGRLWQKLKRTDALIEALQFSSDSRFLDAFQASTMFFLHLPPGCENGLDPNISQQEFLAHIKKCAQDLSTRQTFVPLCVLRDNRHVLLLFTASDLAKPFVQHYSQQVKRLMPFEVLGVTGKSVPKFLSGVDSIVFNPGTAHEHELSSQRLHLLKRLSPIAKAASIAQS